MEYGTCNAQIFQLQLALSKKMITVPGDDLLGWTRVATFHPLLLALESWVPLQCGFQHRTGLLDITLLRGMGILPLPFPAATGTHQPGQLEQVLLTYSQWVCRLKSWLTKCFHLPQHTLPGHHWPFPRSQLPGTCSLAPGMITPYLMFIHGLHMKPTWNSKEQPDQKYWQLCYGIFCQSSALF